MLFSFFFLPCHFALFLATGHFLLGFTCSLYWRGLIRYVVSPFASLLYLLGLAPCRTVDLSLSVVVVVYSLASSHSVSLSRIYLGGVCQSPWSIFLVFLYMYVFLPSYLVEFSDLRSLVFCFVIMTAKCVASILIMCACPTCPSASPERVTHSKRQVRLITL